MTHYLSFGCLISIHTHNYLVFQQSSVVCDLTDASTAIAFDLNCIFNLASSAFIGYDHKLYERWAKEYRQILRLS